MLKDGQCCKVHLVEWKDVRFITRLHRTCISIARIIIVSTDMFSEMNFSEDVYAKGSKDPLRTRPYSLWMADRRVDNYNTRTEKGDSH